MKTIIQLVTIARDNSMTFQPHRTEAAAMAAWEKAAKDENLKSAKVYRITGPGKSVILADHESD